MSPNDISAALHGNQMRRDRSAEPLLRLRRHHRSDETLARGADQDWKTEARELIEPCQHCHALRGRLAEADPWIEHDIAFRDASLCGDIERAHEEGDDIRHDVDRGIDLLAI